MYLNSHTCYSFKFGTMSVEQLLAEAKEKGVRKFVLSDINNTSAILDFHRLAGDYQVQPVAGIDFRNGMQQKFIGIAKNRHGFFELNQFLTECLQEGEKGLTGRDMKVNHRAPEFQDALVVHPFDSLPPDFLNGKPLRANEFIGIKPADLNRLKFSPWKYHPEKLVALLPVTFRNKIDFNAHRLLRAMDNNIVLSKLSPAEQASPDEIILPEEEAMNIYRDFPSLVYNAQKLLDECDTIDFEFGENKNRKYFLNSASEDHQKLMLLCEDGMRKRYPNGGPEISVRFKKEIDVIVQKQFSSYFLINHDIVSFARRNNLFYVGRGSGANSMVAYLLNITDVDPIELDLYFERFINPSRKNPPDFDIDFSSDERNLVIEHIFKTYGNEYAALLGTYSEMKSDSLLRELGKVFGLPKKEIDALQDNQQYPEKPDHLTKLIYQYGKVLYQFPSHLSIHAGGILISQEPMNYYTALSNPPKGFPLVQFSMLEAEDVGFAKFDILSQRGLGKVRDAVDIIKVNKGVEIDIHDVKRFMKDNKVSDNLKQAKLMGCFYVESPAMRMLLTKLEATTYLDLVAASSIIRPGVAQSGMMQEYIRRFHAPDHGEKDAIPELWKIMKETFGVMVYQEDVIKVAHEFGNLTLEESDKLRRGMGGKYRGRAEFLEVKDKFFENCRRLKRDEKVINDVWFQMETFGGYAFAKGHSASYAVESYQCMFLKTYYPLEYLVAVINNGGGFFGVEYYIHEAYMCGGIIHAPDINKSEIYTTIEGNHIYLGLGLLNDLEKEVQQKITEERKRNGTFSSLQDFIKRVSIAVEQLRILIRINAFRFTGRTKQQLLWDIHTIMGSSKKSEARRELFHTSYKNFKLPQLDEIDFRDPVDDMEILGYPLCSPFDLINIPERLYFVDKLYRGNAIVDKKNINHSLNSAGTTLKNIDDAEHQKIKDNAAPAGLDVSVQTSYQNSTPVELVQESSDHYGKASSGFQLPSQYHHNASGELNFNQHETEKNKTLHQANSAETNSKDLLLTSDLKNYKNKIIDIVGYYVTRKPTSTKKGEAMMFGCFLDREGYFFDTNHFPEATRKFPFRGKGCYLVKGKVAEEFGFYSINVLEMYKIDYKMYEEDTETKARSKPDPVIVPPVVPASRQCEYLLVINPPPHVSNEVMLLKRKFHQQFDHYSAVVTKPHITLCNFLESEMKEEEFIRQIASVAQMHAPLRVKVENFGEFPSHTVFLKLLDRDYIVDIVTDLKAVMKLPSKSSRFIFTPHVTIARGLDHKKFARASAEFCEQQYAASFVARSMVLLKRPEKEKFAKYEVVKEFMLEGKSSSGYPAYRKQKPVMTLN